MNILVVDDDERYLNFVRESLFLNGYDVLAASNGSEACNLLDGRVDIDLIISDIRMPTLEGTMLHAFVRDSERYHQTKFIFVGKQGEYSDILNFDPRMDFFFDKGTSVAELMKFVDALMLGVM